jgi:hypothetical protein
MITVFTIKTPPGDSDPKNFLNFNLILIYLKKFATKQENLIPNLILMLFFKKSIFQFELKSKLLKKYFLKFDHKVRKPYPNFNFEVILQKSIKYQKFELKI